MAQSKSMGDHQLCEELALQEIDKCYRDINEESEAPYVHANMMTARLIQYIRERTVGNKDKGNMYLIKTYLSQGKSKIAKKLHLEDLYQFISDLQWIEVHPKKDYSLLEIKKMTQDSKGYEKVSIMDQLERLEQRIKEEDELRWGRLDEE